MFPHISPDFPIFPDIFSCVPIFSYFLLTKINMINAGKTISWTIPRFTMNIGLKHSQMGGLWHCLHHTSGDERSDMSGSRGVGKCGEHDQVPFFLILSSYINCYVQTREDTMKSTKSCDHNKTPSIDVWLCLILMILFIKDYCMCSFRF